MKLSKDELRQIVKEEYQKLHEQQDALRDLNRQIRDLLTRTENEMLEIMNSAEIAIADQYGADTQIGSPAQVVRTTLGTIQDRWNNAATGFPNGVSRYMYANQLSGTDVALPSGSGSGNNSNKEDIN